jgi:hypothetical protein
MNVGKTGECRSGKPDRFSAKTRMAVGWSALGALLWLLAGPAQARDTNEIGIQT